MAAKEAINTEKDSEKCELESINNRMECPVCLQMCQLGVKLPCGHIFCFLCVKGAANLSKRCAMCRKELPLGFLESPELVDLDSNLNSVCDVAYEDGQQWFYEGHNGWWQYDARTSGELEAAFKRQENRCEVLVAGFLYTIDFDIMVQYRRNDPTKRRRIKRDLVTIAKKGIAGIRLAASQTQDSQAPEAVTESSDVVQEPAQDINTSQSLNVVDDIADRLGDVDLNSTETSETDRDEYL